MGPSMNLVSGFPGVGKSAFHKTRPFAICDSDSSIFDKRYFPENYVSHIRQRISLHSIVLVSSHAEVRAALLAARLRFTLVYPESGLKTEYLLRYANRGSPPAFVEMMALRWNEFIDSCESQQGCFHLRLKANKFLSDVLM